MHLDLRQGPARPARGRARSPPWPRGPGRRCPVRRAPACAPPEAEAVLREALARGHEGVVVKSLAAPYQAGRRGTGVAQGQAGATPSTWWSSPPSGATAAAAAWLSNLHLGARDPSGGFVMLGKTFKGLTDAMLEWQTERLLTLATERDDLDRARAARARRRGGVRRRPDLAPATPAAWPCASPASCATARTKPQARPTPSATSSPCAAEAQAPGPPPPAGPPPPTAAGVALGSTPRVMAPTRPDAGRLRLTRVTRMRALAPPAPA